ncbi:MAG: hypothetical protein WC002_03855 [Candidatus Muiribacteriota bacterium]
MAYRSKFIKGLSLIEVVSTVALLGLVALPFFTIFLSGTKYAIETQDDLIAINLARERIEQMKLFSFENLDEDFYIYRDIYRDTIHSEYRGASDDIEQFYKHFSDIWTESKKEQYPRIFSRFESIYQNYEPLVDYVIYPEEFDLYRRYTIVEDYKEGDSSVDMRKITVKVFFLDELSVELVTLISDYR